MSADLQNGGYLLNTNVLCELMREAPAPEVLRWFAAQTPNQLYTSTINQAETLGGIAVLPAGNRRDALALAAIALAAHLKLVTRNTKDFAGIDSLELINPWQPH